MSPTPVRLGHSIAGTRTQDPDAPTTEVFDPSTGAVTALVEAADAAVVERAVTAARDAFVSWRDVSLSKRSQVLFAFRALLAAERDELGAMVSAEHGKVVDDAIGEVQRGLEVVEFACGVPQLLKGAYSENVSSQVDSYTLRQPVGVVVGITPFNFPAMVPMWMFPLAVACGNTFILKPSEKDPSVALRLAELWTRAGLPDGVFNVVNGGREAVDALLVHPDVAAVSFVGSTPVARHVHRTVSDRGARVQALGGAKNHMVVLPDADIDTAADAAVSAAYGSAGERCMAISALVCVGDVADRLVPAIADRIARLRIGPGDDPDNEMGPLITAAHRDRIVGHLAAAGAGGAKVVVDGRDLRAPAGHEGGFWLGPTLLDHVTTAMDVYTEELFGPVLVVLRVASFDEAIALVNANPYGNGTAVFTDDGGAARRFQHEIEVGMVGINVPIPVPMAYHSFGGWKDSLFGDHHVHGMDGVHFYTRSKVVTSRWRDPAVRSSVDLGFPTQS